MNSQWRLGLVVRLLILPSVAGISCSARTMTCGHWGPAVVELRGDIRVVPRYGAPGFGEDTATDAKLLLAMLRLSKPTALCQDSNRDSVSSLTEVQLQFRNPEIASRYNGVRAVVRGSLWPRTLGQDYAAVIMDVDSIALDARLP